MNQIEEMEAVFPLQEVNQVSFGESWCIGMAGFVEMRLQGLILPAKICLLTVKVLLHQTCNK